MPTPPAERIVLNRRRLMQLAGVTTTGAATSAKATPTTEAAARALVSDRISIAAIQTRVETAEAGRAAKAIAANLVLMGDAIDRVQEQAGRKDLITFSSHALQGWIRGDRDDLRAAAIAVDGPEVAAVAAKARQHRSFISFGAWATDPAWPDRVIAMTFLIGPTGETIGRDWAPFAAPTALPEAGRWATTVEAELDAYVEMYGADAVLPVHATAIGNLAQSQAHGAPEIFRALALKGGEIFLRGASLGFQPWDIQASAAYNHCFTVITTAAAQPDSDHLFTGPAGRVGGTAIYGPHGEVLAEAGSKWEQAVVASLPMAQYRAVHQRPALASTLFMPIYRQAARTELA